MKRRNFLTTLAGAPLAAAVGAHKIESYELIQVKVNSRGTWLIVRLKTDKGITGIGDASHGGDARTTEYVKDYFSFLKGRSPFDIEPYRQRLMVNARRGGHPAQIAYSGLEQAMCDLQGKILDLPCWALFGGKLHTKIRNYANINRATRERSPAGFAALAGSAVKAGFDAVKLASFDGISRNDPEKRKADIQLGIDCIAAVRKVIGPDRDLLVDGHSNFSLEEGLDVTRRLEPLNLFWWEEAVRGINNLAEINRQGKMTTAGGEYLWGVEEFFPYIEGRAVDVVMPDVKYCGGMGELKKISALAEGAGLTCAPHGPASPVGNIAAAHVCSTLPNFLILEFAFGEAPWRGELVNPPEVLEKGGYLSLSDRPGLGIEINDKVAKEHAL